MRILLTGGSGFIGANLTRYLIERGHEMHLTVRDTSAWRLQGVLDKVTTHKGGIYHLGNAETLIGHVKPEAIIHLAAYGAYQTSETDETRIIQTNMGTTRWMIDAAIKEGVGLFINAGSSSEYGFCDHPPHEEEAPKPNSIYGWSKAGATQYVAMKSNQIPATTLRLYSVYGPWEEPTRFVPEAIAGALAGKLPTFGDSHVARDFIYVDDVCRAYEAVLEHKGKLSPVYNVGTGQQRRIGECVRTICRLTGCKDEPQFGVRERNAWDSNVWVCDPWLINRELSWKAEYSFKQGIEQLVEWHHQEKAA